MPGLHLTDRVSDGRRVGGVPDEGLGLGVAYGIWAASGVALTAVASKALFKEPLTALMMGGIALIIAGVLLVELGALH